MPAAWARLRVKGDSWWKSTSFGTQPTMSLHSPDVFVVGCCWFGSFLSQIRMRKARHLLCVCRAAVPPVWKCCNLKLRFNVSRRVPPALLQTGQALWLLCREGRHLRQRSPEHFRYLFPIQMGTRTDLLDVGNLCTPRFCSNLYW